MLIIGKTYKIILVIIISIFTGNQLISDEQGKSQPPLHEWRVNTVYFSGNNLISDLELYQQLQTRIGERYNRQMTIEDSQKIAEMYQNHGHENVKVYYPIPKPVNPHEIDLYFEIQENIPYIIKEIKLTGNSYISSERIFQTIGLDRTGSYPLDTVNTFMVQVVDLYASRGFLFAKTRLDSLVINFENNNEDSPLRNVIPVSAYISIDEGRYSRFENYIFTGNKVTRDETLLRISGLDRMQTFSLNNLQLAEENVRRKEYINDFIISPINYNTLLLETDEDWMTHFLGMLGYDSSQPNSSQKITGFINLKLFNLYGTDRSLTFVWRRLQADRQSVELQYLEPAIFNFPVACELSLYRETVDSTYIITSIDSEIYYYSLRSNYGIYIGSDILYPGSKRPIKIDKRSYSKLGIFWHYNSEDYSINPTEGMNLKAKHYYIIHRENQWTAKQSSVFNWRNFFLIDSSINIGIPRPVVLMLSLNGEFIQDKNLQDYELLYLGGINNIRGFRESQFVGNRLLWSNMELRYLLSRKSRIAVFLDYGYLEYSNREEIRNDLVGIGLGLRVDTRIGLIGIDYGFSHNRGNWIHPLDGMIHFGIDSRF